MRHAIGTIIAIATATACPAAVLHAPFGGIISAQVQGADMASSRANKHKLAAGAWQVTQVGASPLDKGSTLSVTFDGATATFFGGCNTIQTTAFFGLDSFRFDVQEMTEMACEEDVAAQERDLLDAIGKVHRLSVDTPGVLGFYDRMNELVMVAARPES